ncbi:terminal protein [Streptomyces ossamyceticus]|nr:terminal protein [Streptomyces ossamyceticus]
MSSEQQLQRITADGLAETSFRAGDTRAHGLDARFTDVERIGIDL